MKAVTPEEIKYLLKKSKTDSAPGFDVIIYPMMDSLATTIPDLIPAIFNRLLTHQVFPDEWTHAKCIPIPEPGRTDTGNPKNIRPISLLSCLGKCGGKCLTTRIAELGKTSGAISDSHFGSHAGLSAADILLTTLTAAQDWLGRQPKINPKPRPARAEPGHGSNTSSWTAPYTQA